MTEYPTPEKPADDAEPENEKPAASPLSQDEIYRRYLEQQRRMSCPGCGESLEFF
jgi:hypothetical protein